MKKADNLFPLPGVISAFFAAALAFYDGQGTGHPMAALGRQLRELSLGSAGGNIAAWAIVLVFSGLPLVAAIHLLCRRRRGEDWLLLLLPPECFALLFYAVNPTLAGPAGEFLPTAILGTMAATLLAWLVLGFLRGLGNAPAERLAAALGALLIGCGLLMVLTGGWSLFTQWRAAAQDIRAGNTGAVDAASRTIAIQGLLALLRLIPYLLGAAAFLWGGRLAARLGADPFGEETMALCDRTAGACRLAAGAMVLLEVGADLMQLLLYSSLSSTRFHLELNLAPLAVTAALYLLCRLFRQGQALKWDNDSII